MHNSVYTFSPMAQAIGTASISFGLVSIPVKLHAATRSSEQISFNLLHGECGSRLKQQYLCAADGQLVERTEMVKGYEFAKGQYVVLSEDEIKALETSPTHSIDITEFVPIRTVDPIYFDKPYFLSPAKGGERAYRLLLEAMKQMDRCAIARYAARGKEYVVCLRSAEGAIVMHQLHYAAEIRSASEMEIGDVPVDARELKMAMQVAEFAAADSFNPFQFQDQSKERIRELIQKKIEGEEITVPPGEVRKTAQVIDLMEALRASLSDVSQKKTASRAKIPLRQRERKPPQAVPVVRPVRAKATRGGKV